jgi:hypothetical protein
MAGRTLRRQCLLKQLAPAVFLAALSLPASASPARAALTVGQVAPGGPPPTTCASGPVDELQPVVTSGNSYVIPGPGTITSWTTNGAAAPGQQLKMKIFRKVGEPRTYKVIASDFRNLAAGGGSAANTFSVSIPVEAGDVLGSNDQNAFTIPNACQFGVPSMESFLQLAATDLSDGAEAPFNPGSGAVRVNIAAQFNPSHLFVLGAVTKHKKAGTATITATLPNPGQATLSGKGVKSASAVAPTASDVQLLIKATGKKKRKLNDTGKVKLNVAITYTPTGGDPSTQSVKVKLIKH